MRLIKGSKLPDKAKKQVLAAYVHRHLDTTCQNDEEWLARHAFYVTDGGNLSRKHKHCEPSYFAEE